MVNYDFKFEIEALEVVGIITSFKKGCPAYTSGLPEDCYPEEPTYYEFDLFFVDGKNFIPIPFEIKELIAKKYEDPIDDSIDYDAWIDYQNP